MAFKAPETFLEGIPPEDGKRSRKGRHTEGQKTKETMITVSYYQGYKNDNNEENLILVRKLISKYPEIINEDKKEPSFTTGENSNRCL